MKKFILLFLFLVFADCKRHRVEWRVLDLGIAPETSLLSQEGKKEALIAKGRINLVFFGFTRCPDFCPLTLSRVDAAIQSANLQNKINLIFVSVDTKNDTPETLQKYLTPYPYARGFVGTKTEIAAVEKSLGAYSKVEKGAIQHSLFVYVLNPQGKVVYLISRNDPLEKISTVLSAATSL
ncbi:MAG: SCO1 protein [Turneriella sp.]|nr:SCO1 protein [Turneriella sp.]